jgi:hypothetical protein
VDIVEKSVDNLELLMRKCQTIQYGVCSFQIHVSQVDLEVFSGKAQALLPLAKLSLQ